MIKTICVCGAGTMGSGIAQVAAQAGFSTMLYDPNVEVIEKATNAIDKALSVLVEKNKLTPGEKEQAQAQLTFRSELKDCKADVIIEAIIEQLEAKIGLFNRLDEINPAETIFASNTSSLSLAAIASKTRRPERLIGLHFFNPAPVMKLVEVVTTSFTTAAIQDAIVKLATDMGKMPVICKDSPGFIVNRIARPYYIEALRLAEGPVESIEQLDKLLEATGFKMGPFKLMDLIGNDINYAVSCSVYEQLDKPERLRPSILQKNKVDKGELGKKTGKGYYDYS